MTKILVFGGRDYSNREFAFYALDKIHKKFNITKVIHGDARGADRLGKQWAIENNIKQIPYPADWDKYGKAAGAIRNKEMRDKGRPQLGVMFEGGNGTLHMLKLLQKSKIPVIAAKEKKRDKEKEISKRNSSY